MRIREGNYIKKFHVESGMCAVWDMWGEGCVQ